MNITVISSWVIKNIIGSKICKIHVDISWLYFKFVSDYEIVDYGVCANIGSTNCPKCKKCPDSNGPSLRRMQEIADSVWEKKRRYTPEVLKLRRLLRKMQAGLKMTTSLPKNPTRTTRNTYKDTTTVVKKGQISI